MASNGRWSAPSCWWRWVRPRLLPVRRSGKLTRPSLHQLPEGRPAIDVRRQPDAEYDADTIGIEAPGKEEPSFVLAQIACCTPEESELYGSGARWCWEHELAVEESKRPQRHGPQLRRRGQGQRQHRQDCNPGCQVEEAEGDTGQQWPGGHP